MDVLGNSIRIVRGEPDRTGDILSLLQGSSKLDGVKRD